MNCVLFAKVDQVFNIEKILGKVRKCCKARKEGTMSIPLNEYKVTNWRYFWIGKPPIQRSVVCDVALAIGIASWELNQELKMSLS